MEKKVRIVSREIRQIETRSRARMHPSSVCTYAHYICNIYTRVIRATFIIYIYARTYLGAGVFGTIECARARARVRFHIYKMDANVEVDSKLCKYVTPLEMSVVADGRSIDLQRGPSGPLVQANHRCKKYIYIYIHAEKGQRDRGAIVGKRRKRETRT